MQGDLDSRLPRLPCADVALSCFPDAQKPSPTEVLRGIMARQLESEAVMAKITSNTMDATSLEKLDHLVREAKQADDEVWMALEASMDAAAAKHGWLAVKKHFENSEVHDSLKARISAKLDAGILNDEKVRQHRRTSEALISWKIRDRSKDERVRLIVRYMIHNMARELQPPEVHDMCEMVKEAKEMSNELLVKWVRASLGDSKLVSDFLAELETVKTAEALRAAGAESWLMQTKQLEDLVVSDLDDKSTEPQMRLVVRNVILHGSDAKTLLAKVADPDKLEALRRSVKLFAKMTDDEIADEMQKAEAANLREVWKCADLEAQTKYVEDLIVGEVPDPRMEQMLRINFRKMIGEAEDGKRALLEKMSDPDRAGELRLAVKHQLESTAIKEMVKNAEISDPAKRVQVENALQRVYRQSQHVGDLVSSGVTDPTMEEKMRSVVRIMIVEDVDLDKLVSKIADPKELGALRKTVEALAEMPDEEISTAVRAFVDDSKRLDSTSDVRFGLDALSKADVKKRMQQVEDTVVRDLVDPPLEAQARMHVRKLFKNNMARIRGFLDTMLDVKVLQEVRANIKTAVAQEQLKLEEERQNKVRRAELMADNRRGQVMMKQELEARKAAEAKAGRMAQALVRQELEAKMAAEHRAERKAEKEREAQHRKAIEAAEREAQKAAEREALEAAERQRKAAQREARERQAAEREARRQEAEDRRAVALVEARCAVQARRAAKKAEKRAAKAQQEPDDTCGICYEPFDAKKKMPMFSKCGDSPHECVMCLQCLLGLANAADGKAARCVCGRDKVVFKMWEPK